MSEEKTLREEVFQAGDQTAPSSAMTKEKKLREKVFEVCSRLSLEKKKITHSAVKEQTKRGSDRDLSYIAERFADGNNRRTVQNQALL